MQRIALVGINDEMDEDEAIDMLVDAILEAEGVVEEEPIEKAVRGPMRVLAGIALKPSKKNPMIKRWQQTTPKPVAEPAMPQPEPEQQFKISKDLLPLVKLGSHYEDFKDFERDYTLNNYHGIFWHLTNDPNFQINPKQAPRDASSMAAGDNDSTPGLMVTTDIENWNENLGGGRKHVAQIDLSDAKPNVDFKNTTRGFGHEIYVFAPAKAKVVRVLPIDRAIAVSRRHYKHVLPGSSEDLKQVWESAQHGDPKAREAEESKWHPVDTATAKDGMQLGNAAHIENGEIVGTHVTDDPAMAIERMSRGEIADRGGGGFRELGPGLYFSDTPQLWTGRARNKWTFLEKMDEHTRMVLGEHLLEEVNEQRNTHYISEGEAEFGRNTIGQFTETGFYDGMVMLAAQPYNIAFWKPEYLKPLGIEAGPQPKKIEVRARGKFAQVDSDRIDEDDYLRLRKMDFDGAFIKGGWTTDPQTVIWNPKAITKFGEYTGKALEALLLKAAPAKPYQPGTAPYMGVQLQPSKKNPMVRRWQGQPKMPGMMPGKGPQQAKPQQARPKQQAKPKKPVMAVQPQPSRRPPPPEQPGEVQKPQQQPDVSQLGEEDIDAEIARGFKLADEIADKAGLNETFEQLRDMLNKGKPTKEMHTDEVGDYTAERRRLHNRIIEGMTHGMPSQAEPSMIFMGGLPGSGKSTLAKIHNLEGYVHIDSDEVKRQLPEYKGWNAALCQAEATDVVAQVLAKAAENHQHVLIDCTLKTGKTYIPQIEEAKHLGYKVGILYSDLPLDKAMQRAIDRFANPEGDHRFVDPRYIASNDHHNRRSFEQLKQHVHFFAAYNNDVPKGTDPVLMEKHGI